MERIVLDTNCLIQILSKKSSTHNVWEAIIADDVVLCVTTEILFEYTEILTQLTGREVADNVVLAITKRPNTVLVTNYYHWNIIKSDPDDNKFVDCAVTANARYVVSNDAHFNVLRTIDFPKLDLINLKEYSDTLRRS